MCNSFCVLCCYVTVSNALPHPTLSKSTKNVFLIKCRFYWILQIQPTFVAMAHGFGQLAKVYGIVTYKLSPFEQRAFAGAISKGVPNMFRRFRSNVFTVAPRKCSHHWLNTTEPIGCIFNAYFLYLQHSLLDIWYTITPSRFIQNWAVRIQLNLPMMFKLSMEK